MGRSRSGAWVPARPARLASARSRGACDAMGNIHETEYARQLKRQANEHVAPSARKDGVFPERLVANIGARPRMPAWRLASYIILVFVIAVASVGAAIKWVGIKALPGMLTMLREYDGARPLPNGYQLWMLHGHPRWIMYGDSTGDTTVPSSWESETQEVGRYAVHGDLVIGEIDIHTYFPSAPAGYPALPPPPVPPRTHFILDTAGHQRREFTSIESWTAALEQKGIDPAQLRWEW